jgi:hypothetical protein
VVEPRRPSIAAGGGPTGHADDLQKQQPIKRLIAVLGESGGQLRGQRRRSLLLLGGVDLPTQLGADPPQP